MAPIVSLVTKALSLLTIGADFVIVLIFFGILLKNKAVTGFFGRQAVFFSFLIAFGSVVGSFFYSEVAGFLPCILCWWQRVLLFPQAVIFLVGLAKKDARSLLYGFWLSFIGLFIGAYNTYLQFGGTGIGDCSATGVSCSVRYFLEFGYVTIPTMSLTAFLLLIALYLANKVKEN